MMNQAFLPRSLIAVDGEEAQAFLNALLTQAIAPPDARRAHYGAMLSPQGKVLFDAFILGRGSAGYWLDVAESRVDLAVQRLKMFALRRKVGIARAHDASLIGLSLEGLAAGAQDGEMRIADPRRPDAAFGHRIYGPGPRLEEAGAIATAWVGLGAPELARDAGVEEVFGLEALLEELHGVDFHKGCFPGQENVSRMKRRATTRRKFCRLRWQGAPPEMGAAITAGPAELGDMRAIADGVGLGLIRLDRAAEAAAAGHGLICAGVELRLDPPDWLIWPSAAPE
jgi:hypothetical protein